MLWCKGSHHTSTCQRYSYKTKSSGGKADTTSKDDKKRDATENRTLNNSQRDVLLVNTAISNKTVVLMQTATVIATNGEDNYRRTKCRLLLDSGSQSSYITRPVADIIERKSIRTENLAIVAFWGSPSECLPRELAGITLSDKKDKESILIESSSGEDF